MPKRSLEEAQRALIGSVIVSGDSGPLATPGTVDLLHGPARAIGQAIVELAEAGQPPDAVLLRARLHEDVWPYLVDAIDGVPRAANALWYREELARQRWRESIEARARGLVDAAGNGAGDGEVAELMQDLAAETYERSTASVRRLDVTNALVAPAIEPPWIIAPWLAEEDTVLLAGEGGVGKSLVLLDLAISLATGTPWMGYGATRAGPRRVLYLDEEQGPSLAASRLQRMAGARGAPYDAITERLTYAAGNRWDVLDQRRADLLRRLIDETRAEVVLVDSLSRIHRQPENRPDAMLPVMLALDRIRDGRALVVIHHMGKPSEDRRDLRHRIRGATSIRDAASCSWVYHQPRSSTCPVLEIDKTRWGGKAAVVVSLEDGPDGIRLTAQSTVTRERATTEALVRAVADLVAESPGLPLADLHEHLECSERHARRAVESAVASGIIRVSTDPQDRRTKVLFRVAE